MLDINEIIAHGIAAIDKSEFVTKPTVTDKMNIINGIGNKLGIDQMSSEHPDAYRFLRHHLDKKLSPVTESKKTDTMLRLIEEAMQVATGGSSERFQNALHKLMTLNRFADDEMSFDEIAFYDEIQKIEKAFGQTIGQAVSDFVTAFTLKHITPEYIIGYFEGGETDVENKLVAAVDQVYSAMIGNDISESVVLKEAPSESIPQSKNFNRYDDDDVVKILKQVCKKEFKDFKLERVTGDQGGAFYSIDVSAEAFDSAADIEMKRIELANLMAKFRAEFFAVVSKVLPVINIKTTPYQFTKNSNKVKFGLLLAISHTNDREWVTGAYKRPDEKKAQSLIDLQVKENMKEAAFAGGLVELGARIIRQEFTCAPGVEVMDVVDTLANMGISAHVINHNSFVAKWSVNKFSVEQIQAIANGKKG